MNYTVYRQERPTKTGETFTTYNNKGELVREEWHAANLVRVGTARSMEEARRLTPYPILGSN